MEPREIIERINEDIFEVISHYVDLKKDGNKYKACCPFHNEKTPSFFVTPARSMFKCFGCGEGGDAISFIQKHENAAFREAVEIGAKKLGIDFTWKESPGFDNQQYQHKESLRIICARAAEFFREQLYKNPEAIRYLKNRGFPVEKDDLFLTGFAPHGNQLMKWAGKQGLNQELLLEAGLLKSKNGNTYDTFRNRIIFPLCDKTGKIIGFTGRTLEFNNKNIPKYLNTAENDIFTKGNELFGLNLARGTIRKEDRVYLVEGNFDVKRLHQTGITNTVAPCGTALTPAQAKLLKRYTNKITLIFDGDQAGKKAVGKNAEILIKEQFHVSVIPLPENEDPDSWFTEKSIFEEACENQQEDYIIYHVNRESKRTKNPVYKSELIKNTAALIARYDETSKHEVYIEAVSRIISPKKAWQDEIKTLVAEKQPQREKKSYIPKGVSLDDYRELGFYTADNCYWFANKNGEPEKRSNFIMNPLFHIESAINAKRLYEVKNIHNVIRVVEIPQKDLVSLSAFRVRIESLGNFLWTGNEADLNRLKAWLYEKTMTAKEITQMGWHRDGFFVWGNGIFNSRFSETDKYGIVTHNEKSYYIPANSQIYQNDETLFEFERRFIHMEGNITLREYMKKFHTVFGENGKIALFYLFTSLFRDIIISRFEKYPLLNLFGPKGAGKNACAESMLHFFGLRQKVPNLHNTSKPALADHVATSANAVCVFDEYRNDIEMEKREFLKGLWDGIGRTRMNMDKDKKKETTPVDQGIIVCGQQMMTADIALFSRVIILSFTQTEYSDQEKLEFEKLEELNKRGITHLTHQLLRYRDHVKEHYKTSTTRTSALMTKLLKGRTVETRIFNNWLSILSVYTTLSDEIDFPWDYQQTMKTAVERMAEQNNEIKRNSDLGQFWKIVQYLISSNIMFQDGDYKSSYTYIVTRRWMEKGSWKKENIEWTKPKTVFWLSTSRVFSLYKNQCNREGDKPLPDSTVAYYLRNSEAFLFETKKESFKKIDPRTNTQQETDGVKKRTSTTAMVFDLDLIDLTLPCEETDQDPADSAESTTETKQSLPF